LEPIAPFYSEPVPVPTDVQPCHAGWVYPGWHSQVGYVTGMGPLSHASTLFIIQALGGRALALALRLSQIWSGDEVEDQIWRLNLQIWSSDI